MLEKECQGRNILRNSLIIDGPMRARPTGLSRTCMDPAHEGREDCGRGQRERQTNRQRQLFPSLATNQPPSGGWWHESDENGQTPTNLLYHHARLRRDCCR